MKFLPFKKWVSYVKICNCLGAPLWPLLKCPNINRIAKKYTVIYTLTPKTFSILTKSATEDVSDNYYSLNITCKKIIHLKKDGVLMSNFICQIISICQFMILIISVMVLKAKNNISTKLCLTRFQWWSGQHFQDNLVRDLNYQQQFIGIPIYRWYYLK